MPPLGPPVALPVPIDIDPDAPDDEVPVLNTSSPLTPLLPAFDVRTMSEPLDFAVPYPDSNEIVPPVLDADLPAYTFINPPLPVVVPSESPAITSIIPPSASPLVVPA